MNLENLKDGLLKRSMSDTTKNGELGDGGEPIEVIIKEFVEEYYGGLVAEMFIEEVIITTDTITILEPGNINMLVTENSNKYYILIMLLALLSKQNLQIQ